MLNECYNLILQLNESICQELSISQMLIYDLYLKIQLLIFIIDFSINLSITLPSGTFQRCKSFKKPSSSLQYQMKIY
jgi:hypothetical protein